MGIPKNQISASPGIRGSAAFANYCSANDVGGVTTWLSRLLPAIAATSDTQLSLLLHSLDSHEVHAYRQSTFFRNLESSQGINLHGNSLLKLRYTENEVMNVLEYLNLVQPRCFLPQCIPAFFYAAQLASSQGLPWVFTVHSDDPDYWQLARVCRPKPDLAVWVTVSEYLGREVKARYADANVVTSSLWGSRSGPNDESTKREI